jgi:hypothetical protein
MASFRNPALAGEITGDLDVSHLSGHEQLYNLWQFWNKVRGERLMPARTDFSPELLKPWLGHIALVDVCENPTRLQYRLVGTRIVDNAKFDATGKYIDELMADPATHPLGRGLVRCLLLKAPVFETVRPRRSETFSLDFHRLALPLSANGRDVTMILLGEYATAAHTRPDPLISGNLLSAKSWL